MKDLLRKVGDAALARPWLAAPPILGVLAQRVLWSMTIPDAGPGGSMGRGLVGALLTVAVTAAFAELYLGDGKSFDAGRFLVFGLVYAIPYPLLLVFGAVAAPVVYGLLHSGAPEAAVYAVLYLTVSTGKLAAYAVGAASSLAVARRPAADGSLRALGAGFKDLKANAGFFFVLLLCAWLLQEALAWAARVAGLGIVSGLVTTAIPLLACVAAPIEGRRSGLLREA